MPWEIENVTEDNFTTMFLQLDASEIIGRH